MQTLDVSSVPQWSAVNGWWFPVSVDTTCPHCNRPANLRLTQPQYDAKRKTMAGSAACPGCGAEIHIWVVEPGPASDPEQMTCRGLLMYPPAQRARTEVPGTDLLPPKVATAYRQALGVYNARLWNVTASCCRQVMEGVSRQLLPSYEIHESMEQNIRRLATSIELRRPVVDVALLLHNGGKLAGYLELTSEPDEQAATIMLEVTEYLLQYCLTLPRLTEEMKRRCDGLGMTRSLRKVG